MLLCLFACRVGPWRIPGRRAWLERDRLPGRVCTSFKSEAWRRRSCSSCSGCSKPASEQETRAVGVALFRFLRYQFGDSFLPQLACVHRHERIPTKFECSKWLIRTSLSWSTESCCTGRPRRCSCTPPGHVASSPPSASSSPFTHCSRIITATAASSSTQSSGISILLSSIFSTCRGTVFFALIKKDILILLLFFFNFKLG